MKISHSDFLDILGLISPMIRSINEDKKGENKKTLLFLQINYLEAYNLVRKCVKIYCCNGHCNNLHSHLFKCCPVENWESKRNFNVCFMSIL